MSANVRGVFLLVLSVFVFALILPDKPALSATVVPVKETTALRAAIKDLMRAPLAAIIGETKSIRSGYADRTKI